MPPQSPNHKEYGSDIEVTAPQARNLAFLGCRSVEISLFSSVLFVLASVKNCAGGWFVMPPLSGPARGGALAPTAPPPPGSASAKASPRPAGRSYSNLSVV